MHYVLNFLTFVVICAKIDLMSFSLMFISPFGTLFLSPTNQWGYYSYIQLRELWNWKGLWKSFFYSLLILWMRKQHYPGVKWVIWSYRVSYWPNFNRILVFWFLIHNQVQSTRVVSELKVLFLVEAMDHAIDSIAKQFHGHYECTSFLLQNRIVLQIIHTHMHTQDIYECPVYLSKCLVELSLIQIKESAYLYVLWRSFFNFIHEIKISIK